MSINIKNYARAVLVASMLVATSSFAQNSNHIVLEEQGSFAVGGKVITASGKFDPTNPTKQDGQTFHGDHAYVFYQKPVNARKYPLVMLHGAGQSSKTWESTPDGREGFQNIFLRRNFSVYLLDQPRRGDAGRSTEPITITPTPDEQFWFGQFRVGIWPNVFDGSQFPKGEEALNQYFRQITPNTGAFDYEVISDALSSLHGKIGPSILITHSQGGGSGWRTAMKSENVKAIISYEPGSGFTFPEGETPDTIPNGFNPLSADTISLSEFMKLTKIPIIIYYGDNIPTQKVDNPSQDYWRASMSMAKKWVEVVNKHGGDAKVVYLPDAGMYGNTHFPFSDLNNIDVANHLSAWLKEKGLD